MDLIGAKKTISIVIIIIGCTLLFVPILLLILGFPFSILLLEAGGLLVLAFGYLFKVWTEKLQRGSVYKLLRSNLDDLKKWSYEELMRLMVEPKKIPVRSNSGMQHTLKFEAFWKNVEDGDLRVIGSFDPESSSILTKDWVEFVISQDGTLVEEEY